MSDPTRDFDAEETKLLTESISDGEVRVGPSDEYVADLRRRLLSVTVPARVTREKSKGRILLGAICGACAAAMLVAAIWFWRAEPAWASVIRATREQVWIHNQIERDGLPMGETWVSPELDIVAAKFSTAVLFFDYKHSRFARYDSRDGVVFLANEPDTRAKRELSSVSQLTEVFRRSAGALSLFPDQIIQHWRLHSAMVDGIPCDEYEIVTQPPDGPPATILLTIEKRRSLLLALTRVDGESHAITSRFDYPFVGPLDERSALLGIPADAPTTDTDKTREVQGIADALEQGRRDFDDYTAFSVTSRFDVPLLQCDVMRTLKKGNKWRMDSVTLSDRKFVLPKEHDRGLSALRGNRDLLQLTPEVICDGKAIHCYKWLGEFSTDGRPVQSFKLTDDTRTDSLSPALCFPERAARPIFYLGPLGRRYAVTTERDQPFAGVLKIDSLQTPTARNPSPPPSDLYWLSPKMGNVAVKTVLHPIAARTESPKRAPASPLTEFQTTFSDFKQSPRGYWYPRVVNRGDITRFYVDFTEVPSDEMFRKDNPAP